MQVGDLQDSHLSDKTYRSLEPETDDPKTVVAVSRHRNHPSEVCEGDDLYEEPAKDPNGMPSQGQPNPKGCRSGLVKPHAEVKALAAPHAGQYSELPIHPDTKNTLYAGEKLMPKLVTA